MGIEQWWARLGSITQQWLIDHNGEALPPAIVSTIVAAGGPDETDSWWSREDGRTSIALPDDAVDWVESTANGEND